MTLAYCDLNLKNSAAAQGNAFRARSYAHTVSEKNQIEELLKFINQNTNAAPAR